MKNTVKCLVTGGAGFIGSHLCDFLISKGDEVFCVDNLITGSKKNILHLIQSPRFHFLLHDITRSFPKTISYQLSTINYLYHLASPASPPQYRRYAIETLLTNSVGTYHMLELAKHTKARFLLASTSEVYGDPQKHPQKESYFGNVNPIGVRACYDEGKRFAEAITMEYVRKYALDARIARIFNTYGPRMQRDDGRVISNFINQAILDKPLTMYGDGLQTRSFCYVSDMTTGLISAMEKKNTKGVVVNLGYPKEHKIKDIAQLILQLTLSSSTIRSVDKPEDDPRRRKPDISKAKNLLDWEPKVPLEKGVKKTIDYFRNL
jgi:nucleoside-diphosphate-sugar epimerase